MGWLEALQRRMARDDGATEVIAYVFMFAIGSMALVFAMDVRTDAQRRGGEVAAAKQAEQFGQLTGSLVEQAARVAQRAPNATYETNFQPPTPVGNHNLTVEITRTPIPGVANPDEDCDYRANAFVHSDDDRISTRFQLGNVSTVEILTQCLEFRGELDTSAQAARVRYDPPAEDHAAPTIVLEPTSKVT